MRGRLLLEGHRPEIVHIAGITNTVVNIIDRLDMDPPYNVSKDILKGLEESDYTHGKHVHLTRVFSQLLQDNSELGTSVGECYETISEAVEDIFFPVKAELLYEQRADATL